MLNIKSIIKTNKSERIFLFADFDGTLVKITGSPKDTVLDGRIKRILKCISEKENIVFGIISGRSIESIKKLVGLKSIAYSGNYGFEAELPCRKMGSVVPKKDLLTLEKIWVKLTASLKSIPRKEIENKKYTLTVHYRQVDKKYHHKMKVAFLKTILPYALAGKVVIKYGKEVLEAWPPVQWSKASAVKWLLKAYKRKSSEKVIYVGDDVSDEEVFKYIRSFGYGMCVGCKEKALQNTT